MKLRRAGAGDDPGLVEERAATERADARHALALLDSPPTLAEMLPARPLGALVQLSLRKPAKPQLERLGCDESAHVRHTIQARPRRSLREFPYT